MKKLLVFVMAAAIVALFSAGLYAEEEGTMEGEMVGKGMMYGGMMEKGMMHEKMMEKGMMMKGMMGKEIVATNDGGIVILIGRKLLKYDKDLNLVKEVEIKMDKTDWKMMMGGCPWGEKKDAMKEESEEKDSDN